MGYSHCRFHLVIYSWNSLGQHCLCRGVPVKQDGPGALQLIVHQDAEGKMCCRYGRVPAQGLLPEVVGTVGPRQSGPQLSVKRAVIALYESAGFDTGHPTPGSCAVRHLSETHIWNRGLPFPQQNRLPDQEANPSAAQQDTTTMLPSPGNDSHDRLCS